MKKVKSFLEKDIDLSILVGLTAAILLIAAFVFGFAIGMFLTGALHWDNRILELIGAVAGFVVGWWIDGKYYAEKDIPADQLEAEQTTQESQ